MKKSNDFSKRLKEIADSKIERSKNMKTLKEIQEELRITQEENKRKFRQIKKDVMVPKVKELQATFEEAGDLFQLFSEDQATALQDQIRTFFQVFYFAGGNKKFGFNSPSLLFECNPSTGEVVVSQHTELRPTRFKEVGKISVDSLNEEEISQYILDFVGQLMH